MQTTDKVEKHYTRENVLGAILAALRDMGKDLRRLTPDDLAPVDEFHIRGRDATVELAGRAHLERGTRVLDVGSGLGGSARYLVAQHGCIVTGVDLTKEYVEIARSLAALVGLGDAIRFDTASALALPFADATFDVVWTEHAQMNIADKQTFYAEAARVLVPGGQLVFHDFFRGVGPEPQFPVPWADDASISFLARPAEARAILEGLGMRVLAWEDRTRASYEWLENKLTQGPPPLGIHLLMGPTARAKLENVVLNLREGRVAVAQAVVRKER